LSFTNRAFTVARRARVRTPFGVAAPDASTVQPGGDRCAPTARVEPAAPLPGRTQPIGVAPGAPDGLMHLGEKGLRSRQDGPHGASTGAVADPARTDAKLVVVFRHEATIGRSIGRQKIENGVVGP